MRQGIRSISFATILSVAGPTAFGAAVAQMPQERIAVHGHWAIDVRNPDGTLVMHREVDNALDQITGSVRLAQILRGTVTAGRLEIFLGGTNTPWGTDETPDLWCRIVAPGYPQQPGGPIFRTLETTVTSNPPAIVLKGSATAARAGYVPRLQTTISSCGPETAPQSCTPVNFFGFTSVDLSAPVGLAQGQIVQVTVSITFS